VAPLPFRRAAVLLAAALTAAGCAQPFASGTATGTGALRVGLLVPGTGGGGEQAPAAEEGAQLAVDVVNEATSSVPLPLARSQGLTGLDGAPARLLVDRRVDAMSTAQVERLAKDRDVDVLVGVGGREDLLTTSRQAERLTVPYVGGGSSSGFLTERGLEWFFHTAPSDAELGLSFMNVLERRPHAGGSASVAIVHPENTEGTAVAQDVAQSVEARGYTSVLAPVPPAQRDDVGAQREALDGALAEGDVAGVVLVARHAVSARAAAEAAATTAGTGGVSAVLGLGEGFTEEKVQDSLADLLPGVLVSAPWPSDTAGRSLTAASVAELFRTRYGHRMDAAAAQAFTATYTVLRAAEAAGSTDGEQLRASLSALEIAGRELVMPWDGVRFDERHRNVAARGSLEQVSSSGGVLVEPEELARGDVAWGVGDTRGA
jgi:branched-chain amino acid transport system substrate-binding protein